MTEGLIRSGFVSAAMICRCGAFIETTAEPANGSIKLPSVPMAGNIRSSSFCSPSAYFKKDFIKLSPNADLHRFVLGAVG